MHTLKDIIKLIRWFGVSAAVVLALAISLSAVTLNVGSHGIHYWITEHSIAWLAFRLSIIGGLVGLWPCFVKQYARRYQWSTATTDHMIHRRWRYALWLILIDLTFHLL